MKNRWPINYSNIRQDGKVIRIHVQLHSNQLSQQSHAFASAKHARLIELLLSNLRSNRALAIQYRQFDSLIVCLRSN